MSLSVRRRARSSVAGTRTFQFARSTVVKTKLYTEDLRELAWSTRSPVPWPSEEPASTKSTTPHNGSHLVWAPSVLVWSTVTYVSAVCFAYAPCLTWNCPQVPGTAAGESHLGPAEIEIGMGIHNEPGHRRLSPVPPLNELLPQLVEFLTVTTDSERSFLPFKNDGSDRVVLLVNNLGGTSELELGSVAGEARRALEKKGVKVERLISGTFMVRSNFALSISLIAD